MIKRFKVYSRCASKCFVSKFIVSIVEPKLQQPNGFCSDYCVSVSHNLQGKSQEKFKAKNFSNHWEVNSDRMWLLWIVFIYFCAVTIYLEHSWKCSSGIRVSLVKLRTLIKIRQNNLLNKFYAVLFIYDIKKIINCSNSYRRDWHENLLIEFNKTYEFYENWIMLICKLFVGFAKLT